MAKITVGSTVRYVGEQKPELAGVEGVVTDINAANRTAHVFWAHAMRAIRQGRKQHEPTWEPGADLKPIRAFTKDFRQGALHSAQQKMRGNKKIREIPLDQIRGVSEDTWFTEELRDDYPPVIVEWIPGDGGYYDLIDGQHRVGTAREQGMQSIRAHVATPDELNMCSEFGDGDMSEAEWIEWMQDKARGKMKNNAKTKKRKSVDFEDENDVLTEMASALKEDADDLEIDTDSGLEGFGEGTVYRIEQGRVEYVVVEDTDQMYALALAVVKQDLEEEPELFEQSFLEGHIDKDKLRRELEPDELNSRIDDITYEAELRPDEFWEEYEREGFEAPEEDEDGERREPDSDEIEELAEKQVKDRLEDPMEYLEEVYGDEAVAKAMEIAGFDIDAAAEDAVETDGPEHFLARYDGNYYETASGFVYWRDN